MFKSAYQNAHQKLPERIDVILNCKVQSKDLHFKLQRMLTIASYFLCPIRLNEEQNYNYVTPSENQLSKTTKKETWKYKTFRTFSAPLKSEKTEETYQDDYYPGMLTYLLWNGKKFS